MRRDREASMASLSWAPEIAVNISAVAPGVGHRQVQPALVVLDAVAGEVEQRQVLAPASP